MRIVRLRPFAVWALFSLVLGIIPFSSSVSAAQDKPESQRKILNRVVPNYPDLARQMDIKGMVRIGVTVAPSGVVKQSQLIGGHPVLAKAAMDAIGKWKWAPATQESKELIELNFHP